MSPRKCEDYVYKINSFVEVDKTTGNTYLLENEISTRLMIELQAGISELKKDNHS